ncbi:hypothetical protein OJ996_19855 [Luteolibacter sp. GHJ8]|uniref:Uncharacterized protein n=1 Tax=Luteolibacter rhizosphaerae TaxID=2989719 RepID=A0ABT3G7L7_9BACT|nr:hypothetical protein [Luteolibacter rhizosphaerae]MCW1915852.1 hypothetical protein [Luteolibacter rhizosphaerae]
MKVLTLNGCYFGDMDAAVERFAGLFPNAEHRYMLFEDFPDMCIARIEPDPGVSEPDHARLLKQLEAVVADLRGYPIEGGELGPPIGEWKPRNADAWKQDD